ncbi:MAG: hypothetical protein KJS97_03675 [Alphaproteobacteria bacterium]|nr:hypothetical protein [Alphaproteobacteria bacterium]
MQDIAAASRSSNALVVLHFKSLDLLLVESCLEVFRTIARRCIDQISATRTLQPGSRPYPLSYTDAARIVTDLETWEFRCVAYAEPRMVASKKLPEFQSIVLPILRQLASETGILDGAPPDRAQICADIFVPYYSHATRLVVEGALTKQAFAERLVDIAQLVRKAD